MPVTIRTMKVEDIGDVKRADLLAWSALIESKYPEIKKFSPRTDQNIISYLHSDPEGAFVAIDDFAGIIGYSFSHIWGRTGWVGPLAVLPTRQGMGVGKELLRSSLRHLEDRGCTDIGLETMPENQINLGLYLGMGLRPEGLVVLFGKQILKDGLREVTCDGLLIERLSESNVRNHLMSQIKRLSSTIHPGLDYTPEVKVTEEYSFGETLVALSKGIAVGLCVVHTVSKREDMPGSMVRVLAVTPGADNIIVEALIHAAELVTAEDRSIELSVPVPGRNRKAMDVLLSREYTVVQTFERMMWQGNSGLASGGNNLCSWSG